MTYTIQQRNTSRKSFFSWLAAKESSSIYVKVAYKIMLFCGLFCFSQFALGQNTAFWTGTIDNDWNKPGNWIMTPVSGTIPTASYDVVIPTGTPNDCQITANSICRSITIDGTLTIVGSPTLTVNGSWSIDIAAIFNPGAGTIIFENNGVPALNAATIAPRNSATVANFYHIQVNRVGGTLTQTIPTVTLSGNFTNNGGTYDVVGTHIFTVNGNYTLNAGTFEARSATINIGGAFSDTPSSTFNSSTSTVRFIGNTSNVQIYLPLPDSFYNVEVAKNNSNIKVASSLTIRGNLIINSLPAPPASPVLSMLFDFPSVTVNVQGQLLVNSGGIDMSLQDFTFLNVTGKTTVNGGKILIARPTTNSTISMNGGLEINAGSVEVGTTGVTAQSRLRVIGNTIVNDGLLFINAATAEFFGNIDLLAVGNPNFSPTGTNVIVSGNWTNEDESFFTGASSTVTFTGNTNTIVTGYNRFASITVLKDPLPAPCAGDVAYPTLTSQGDVSNLGSFIIDRDLAIQQGTLVISNMNGPDMYLTGNLVISNNASLDISASSGGVEVRLSGNLTDLNDQEPSNVCPRRGLYIGTNPANPMGVRGCASGGYTTLPVQALPTIVFTGNKNQIISGKVKLRNYCGQVYTNEASGIALPNIIVNKTPAAGIPSVVQLNTSTNLRVHGDLTINTGSFLLNSNTLLFGDHVDDEILINTGGIFHADKNSRIYMNTGTSADGTFLKVNGGALRLIGASGQPVVITREGTPGQYYRMAAYKGTVEAIHTTISYQGGSNNGFAVDPGGADWHTNSSAGGFKIYSQAVIDPDNLGYNFSYCVLGANGAGGLTSLTINTGQDLNIIGTTFNTSGSSGVNVTNNNTVSPGILTFIGSLGELGGVNGEPNDAGSNEVDGVIWETFTRMYWVSSHSPGGFRGPGENHTGSTTAWSNPKNWSLMNNTYHNPNQVFPGQMTGIPAAFDPDGAGPKTIPADTLQKFEVFIAASAPNAPTLDGNYVIQGTLINNAVGKDNQFDISPVGTRSGKTLIINGRTLEVWGDFVNNNRNASGGNLTGTARIDATGLNSIIRFRANLASFHTNSFIDIGSNFLLEAQGKGSLQEIKIATNDLREFTINKNEGKVVVQGFTTDRIDILGNLNIVSGGLELLTNTPMRVDGNFNIAGGFFKFNGSSTIIRGNWNNTGGTIFTDGGTVNFYPNSATNKIIRSNGQAFNVVNFGIINDQLSSVTPTNINSPGATKYILQDDFTAVGLTTVAARGQISGGPIYNDNPTVTAANGVNPPQERLVEVATGVSARFNGLRIRENGTFTINPSANIFIKNNTDNFTVTNINPFPNTIPKIGIYIDGAANGYPNGKLNVIGTDSEPAGISRNDISGEYNFKVNGTISARYYYIEWMDAEGINLTASTSKAESPGSLNGGVASTVADCGDANGCINPPVGCFSDGILTLGSTAPNASYIQYLNNTSVFGNPSRGFLPDTIFNAEFNKVLGVGGANIRRIGNTCAAPPGGILWFKNAGGRMPGESYDDDGSACAGDNTPPYPSGQIRWFQQQPKLWDGGMADGGNPTDPNDWQGNPRVNNTDWHDPKNWNPDGVPLSTDIVVLDRSLLDAAYTVEISSPVVINNLEIKNEEVPTPNDGKPIELIVYNGPLLTVKNNFAVVVPVGEDNLAKLTLQANSEMILGGSWDNSGRFTSGNNSLVRFGAGYTSTRVISNIEAPVPTDPYKPSARAFNTFHNIILESGVTQLNSPLMLKNDLTVLPGVELNANVGSFPIIIEGNWTSSGKFTHQRGTVVFAGDKGQTIWHKTAQAENFYTLQIEKNRQLLTSPTISDSVVLLNRVTVANKLDLQYGRFIADSTGKELIMLVNTITRRPGALSNTAFVRGPLGHLFSGNGGEPRNYYLGDKRHPGVASFGVTLSDPNPAAATVFTIQQIDSDPDPDYRPDDPNNPSPPGSDRIVPKPINYVSKSRYWKVKNIAFAPNSSGTYADLMNGIITLPFAPEDESIDTTTTNNWVNTHNTLNNLLSQSKEAVILRDGADGPKNTYTPYNPYTLSTQYNRGVSIKATRWDTLGGIVNVNEDPSDPDNTGLNPTVTSMPFTTLGNGDFTFGFNYVPLPVELLSFKAFVINANVRVEWITANERNTAYYYVQRSSNGRDFQTIGTIKAAGNSAGPLSYYFLDKSPISGITYYRLEEVDLDGNNIHSRTEVVSITGNTSIVSVFPNPSNGDMFSVAVSDLAGGSVTISLYDIVGRQILDKEISSVEGNVIDVYPSQRLSPGVYMVLITTAKQVHKQKLIIK